MEVNHAALETGFAVSSSERFFSIVCSLTATVDEQDLSFRGFPFLPFAGWSKNTETVPPGASHLSTMPRARSGSR